jgi:O-antigen/teichoic acid export membrane protein
MADPVWGIKEPAFRSVARNVSSRYVAYLIDGAIGLLMLPFNLEHLGKPLYGVWILVVSVTVSFSLLDIGYAGSMVRFISRYRASRDSRALNQILSTLLVVYSVIGVITFTVALILQHYLGSIFNIDPANLPAARHALLIVSGFIALQFGCSVFGGVVVGFQRHHLNNITSVLTSVAVAAVNVAVLSAGFGLVGLVAATTGVRAVSLLLYRHNAYRAFPGLRLRLGDFRRSRLREVTGFSVYMLLLDIGVKLNYAADTLVLGAFAGPAAVALWAPADRLTQLIIRLTNQLNETLFPFIVASDTKGRTDQLRQIYLQGTRLTLATVIPLGGGVALLAHPLIESWVGPSFDQTATVLQMLATLVILRVGNSTGSGILKGAGLHRRHVLQVGLTGIANIVLSIVLVRSYGLVGVAIGTIVPVVINSALGTFPLACRRVGVPIGQALRQAVWPAVWPAVGMIACIRLTAPIGEVSLFTVGVKLLLGAVVYEALFLGVASTAAERHLYMVNVRSLLPGSWSVGSNNAARIEQSSTSVRPGPAAPPRADSAAIE